MWASAFATPLPAKQPRWRDVLLALVCACGLPFLIGAGLILSALALKGLIPFLEQIWAVFFAIGLFLFYSPFISPFGLLPGALIAYLALKIGKGGWATALLTGLALGLILGSLDGRPLGIFLIFGPPFGVLYWHVLRRFSPETFSMAE